jgi:hypothetical protein
MILYVLREIMLWRRKEEFFLQFLCRWTRQVSVIANSFDLTFIMFSESFKLLYSQATSEIIRADLSF